MIYTITKNGKDHATYHNRDEAVEDLELHQATEPETFALVENDESDFYETIERPMYA